VAYIEQGDTRTTAGQMDCSGEPALVVAFGLDNSTYQELARASLSRKKRVVYVL
jgi:hypothetical protein